MTRSPFSAFPRNTAPSRPLLLRHRAGFGGSLLAFVVAAATVAGCGESGGGAAVDASGGGPSGGSGVGGAQSGVGGTPSSGGAASGGQATGGAGLGTGGGDAGGGTLGVGGNGGGGPATGGAGTGGGGDPGSGGGAQVSQDFTISVQRADEVDASAPTTVGIVSWSLAGATVSAATIEFGLDETYGMTAPVDLGEADYRTLLLGMKPMSSYHFRIVATTEGGQVVSEDQTIETGAATTLVSLQSFDVKNEAARERGFLVTSFWRGNGSSVVFILDADGEVVWWYDSGANGIARARMSADGKNMWMVEPNNQGAPLRRVTMDTLDPETYSDVIASHDLTPVTGATMAYLEYGEADCDSIFEIDPSGATQEIFESETVASGQCHGNALRYSKKEDVYTMSDVSTDIWVISRAGEYQWGLAEKVEGGVGAWGGRNHGHHLLDDSLLILANAGAGQMESSAIEYDLEGNEIFRYEAGEFTANLGDVQRLPGGNTLVTFSNNGVIHEVTPEKELVLEITAAGQAFGYALWRESLYGEPPDLGL